MKDLITIFTPTYNRAKTLNACYNSLKSQSSKEFVWQIVDDGSTDNTESLVKTFISEKEIDIIYIRKENGGKASAINLSLEKCNTELWMCLDSDDLLTKNAISKIINCYSSIKNNKKVCGIFALRSTPDEKPMQKKYIPKEIKYTTQNQVRYKFKIPPEYVHVYKTEIIKKYKYPKIQGENYFPLSYVFDQIDKEYTYLVSQEALMICEYREDGMTRNKRNIIKKNPIGYMIYKRQAIDLAPDLISKVKACITYNTACILSNEKEIIKKSPQKFLTAVCYPFGVLDYLLRYKKL